MNWIISRSLRASEICVVWLIELTEQQPAIQHLIHTTTQHRGATIVTFKGEFDLDSSPKSRQILLKAVDASPTVLVNLSGVTYIDNSSVATLVESLQVANSKHTRFSLVDVSEPVCRALQLARLDQVFRLYTSVDEALA